MGDEELLRSAGLILNDPFVLDGIQRVSARDHLLREILLADELGSGMRNSYKYTRLYCGGEPEFSEEDTFTLTIPLTEIANPVVNAPASVPPDEGNREKTTQKTTQK